VRQRNAEHRPIAKLRGAAPTSRPGGQGPSRCGAAWQGTKLIFTTRYGTPIEPRHFNRYRDRRCEKAGVRTITVHHARRTCGSLLADLDVHPRVAMQILRHAQFSITMEIYTEVSSEQTREALRRLGRALDELLRYFRVRRSSGLHGTGSELVFCGPPGTRTLNLRIKSPQLWRLPLYEAVPEFCPDSRLQIRLSAIEYQQVQAMIDCSASAGMTATGPASENQPQIRSGLRTSEHPRSTHLSPLSPPRATHYRPCNALI
jgi:hypothetical protein